MWVVIVVVIVVEKARRSIDFLDFFFFHTLENLWVQRISMGWCIVLMEFQSMRPVQWSHENVLSPWIAWNSMAVILWPWKLMAHV